MHAMQHGHSTARSKVAVSVSSFGYEKNTNSTSYRAAPIEEVNQL